MTGRKKIRYSDFTPAAPAAATVPATTPASTASAVPPVPGQHRLTPLRGSVIVPSTYTPAHGVPALRGPVDVYPVDRGALRDATTRAAAPLPDASPVLAPSSLRERARARTGRAELLVFRIGSERFGVDLSAVEEAIDLESVHHVPEMPPAMLGVITVRGTLTLVYSPRMPLGLALSHGTSALVFRRGEARFALVIDDVDDVMSLDLALLRDAPGVDQSDGVLLGVVRTDDALLALVDADALLAACQAVPALETA